MAAGGHICFATATGAHRSDGAVRQPGLGEAVDDELAEPVDHTVDVGRLVEQQNRAVRIVGFPYDRQLADANARYSLNGIWRRREPPTKPYRINW